MVWRDGYGWESFFCCINDTRNDTFALFASSHGMSVMCPAAYMMSMPNFSILLAWTNSTFCVVTKALEVASFYECRALENYLNSKIASLQTKPKHLLRLFWWCPFFGTFRVHWGNHGQTESSFCIPQPISLSFRESSKKPCYEKLKVEVWVH